MIPLEIRELVRLKKGVGGLEPPYNIGILLGREKAGKDHIGIIYTMNGELKVKWKNLREAWGRTYEGEKKDNGSMLKFLKQAVDEEKKGLILTLEAEEIIEKVSVEDLWNSVMEKREKWRSNGIRTPEFCDNVILSGEMIGNLFYEPKILEKKHISAVAKVLSSCDDPSYPYFHRMDIDGKRSYLPYSKETQTSIKDHISRLEDLRSVFVQITDEEIESGHTLRSAHPRFEDPRDAVLSQNQELEMDIICDWANMFLGTGKWTYTDDGGFGLGGTPAWRMNNFDLERYISDLSHHISNSGGRDLASDLVGMLLKLEKISWMKASELVVDYNLGSGKRKFHRNFPQHVLRKAKGLDSSVREEEIKGRKDLRNVETYTIDPPDAKDFDDAVSISTDDEGNWEVWVHIADVSHYVRSGDLIDDEARYRGTSVYLPTGVISMLPPELSEELCSLKEGVERLTVSTLIRLSSEMKILSWDHYKSVIKVDRNLSYNTVDRYINEGVEPFTSLQKVSEGLRSTIPRLDLDIPERRVRFTGDNEIDVNLKRQTKAMVMIEQLMVITNEAAASTIGDNGLSVPYRVHPLPDSSSIEKFNATCRSLGLNIELPMDWIEEVVSKDGGERTSPEEDQMLRSLLSGGKVSFGALNMEFSDRDIEDEEEGPHTEGEDTINGTIVPKEAIDKAIETFNKALGEIGSLGDMDRENLLKLRMLRTMPRAFYSEDNIGHFGLGSECYCHFTSPIRRYPDILAHRAITSIIEQREGPGSGSDPPTREEISGMMEHVNEMTEDADGWEREMVDVALATRSFMDKEFRNRSHGSIVRSLTPSMIFLGLDDGVTEGRIPIRTLSPLRLHIDDDETSVIASLQGNEDSDPKDPIMVDLLKNEGSDIVLFKIGDRRNCKVYAISISQGKIDLSLSNGH